MPPVVSGDETLYSAVAPCSIAPAVGVAASRVAPIWSAVTRSADVGVLIHVTHAGVPAVRS